MRVSRASARPAGEAALDGVFGFDPAQGTAHFLLLIPEGPQGLVEISEHLSWDPEKVGGNVHLAADRADGQVRSRCARGKWNDIADAVRAEFNSRLKAQGRRPGRWKSGYNALVRSLGKELCLLLWAIEDADPALIPTALANWQGLTPEERWWLYTMTAAATGNYATGRNVGWRKAVRFALTENPVAHRAPSERVVPEFFRLAAAIPAPEAAQGELPEDVDAATESPPEEESPPQAGKGRQRRSRQK